MAAGRPVVATNVGHVASIVDDGVEGFLVTPGDVLTLAERLLRLLTDAKLATFMGRAARARAASHDVRVIARTLLQSLKAVSLGAVS
jgi:glycosyltransferase involved in cell wall biosynthesis